MSDPYKLIPEAYAAEELLEAVLAERERCAKIAEGWYLLLEGVGLKANQGIRKKAGAAIAGCIRSGK